MNHLSFELYFYNKFNQKKESIKYKNIMIKINFWLRNVNVNVIVILLEDSKLNESIAESENAEAQGSIQRNINGEREYFDDVEQLRDGLIYEISMLRRSSSIKKVEKTIKLQAKKKMKNIKVDKIKSVLDKEDEIFDLRAIRKFKHVNRYFGDNVPTITSVGTLASWYFDFNKNTTRLFYENQELNKFVEEKLGIDGKTFENFKVDDFNWKILSPGFIGFKDDQAVFIKIDVEITKNKESVYNEELSIEVVEETIVVTPKPNNVNDQQIF